MHRYNETKILPYTPNQLFNLVMDVESYPQFLPWCRAARITRHVAPGECEAELIIRFSHFTERYTSRICATPPAEGSPGRIEVESIRGPFKTLNNRWVFEAHSPTHTAIHLELQFEFKLPLLDRLMGGLFGLASQKMIGAFTARAEALYGTPTA